MLDFLKLQPIDPSVHLKPSEQVVRSPRCGTHWAFVETLTPQERYDGQCTVTLKLLEFQQMLGESIVDFYDYVLHKWSMDYRMNFGHNGVAQ